MTEQKITTDMTINEIVEKYPSCLNVLSAYGIDTCCGGALPLGTVIEKHKLQDEGLIEALEGALFTCSSR